MHFMLQELYHHDAGSIFLRVRNGDALAAEHGIRTDTAMPTRVR